MGGVVARLSLAACQLHWGTRRRGEVHQLRLAGTVGRVTGIVLSLRWTRQSQPCLLGASGER